jgi:histidine triad (HIT) family protein
LIIYPTKSYIDAMNDPNCIFCKIVKKEIPATVVHEDDISMSFLDINPVNEGHLLLIPKEHHSYLVETPDSLLKDLIVRAKKLMIAMKKSLNPDVVVLSVVGKDVAHFHIQLIPRFPDDGLGGFWPSKKYESFEKMNEIKEKIKSSISSL